MKRRQFLQLTAAGLVAAAAPAIATPRYPRIVADGVFDDGPGLAAAFSGKPFEADPGIISVRPGRVTLSPLVQRTFVTREMIVVRALMDNTVYDGSNNFFQSDGDFISLATLGKNGKPVRNVTICNFIFVSSHVHEVGGLHPDFTPEPHPAVVDVSRNLVRGSVWEGQE